ncbi:MAG: response regulator transcription factor, partial [Limisphaerales bacterium]
MNSEGSQIKVLLVDDHPLLRQGITQLINQEKDLTVCGEAENANEALQAIASTKPDIVILDISLKEASGIELLKDIKIQYPKLPVLMLSMHDESVYAQRALRAGAGGYITKQEATEKVLIALRRVLSGQVYLSEALGTKMLNQMVSGRNETNSSPLGTLSDRELEVFCQIGEGYGTRQIAEKLHLSVKTIESHRSHIKEKLNLKTA